jgi:hypothetical protein
VEEWNYIQDNADDSISYLETKLKKLLSEKQKVSELAKAGVYTPDEARDEMEHIRDNLTVTEVALNDAKTDHIEAELVLDEGLKLFRNVSSFWMNADVEAKQKLQFQLFPEGVIYGNESFSNRQISPCIGAIRSFEANNHRMG